MREPNEVKRARPVRAARTTGNDRVCQTRLLSTVDYQRCSRHGGTRRIIVIAQVMAGAGTGGWFPLTAPALWAIDPSVVSSEQLTLVAIAPTTLGLLIFRAWATFELDRERWWIGPGSPKYHTERRGVVAPGVKRLCLRVRDSLYRSRAMTLQQPPARTKTPSAPSTNGQVSQPAQRPGLGIWEWTSTSRRCGTGPAVKNRSQRSPHMPVDHDLLAGLGNHRTPPQLGVDAAGKGKRGGLVAMHHERGLRHRW